MHFKKENVQVTQDQFMRYIRPQLKAILQEFFHLLRKFQPLNNDIISVRNSVSSLTGAKETWKIHCGLHEKECGDFIKDQHSKATEIEKELATFRKDKINLGQEELIDDILNLYQHLDTISILNYKILHSLEEFYIIYGMGLPIIESKRLEIYRLESEMEVFSELILSGLLTQEFAHEFDFFWFNFLSPIEKRVIDTQNFDFFLDQMGELNTVINSFHMRLAKSQMPTPTAIVQLVGIIHNRWNSILKLIMNNYKE